jgi:predicted ribosomally synthesized peptide with nif11-like leader
MSVLANLTPEQIAAFEGCKTKDELVAKAKELGLEPSEADLEEAMVLLSAESGELSDDALDAVAGGKKQHKNYKKVKKGTNCQVPEYYEPCPPDQYRWKDDTIGQCGTCKHCYTMDGKEVCVKQAAD